MTAEPLLTSDVIGLTKTAPFSRRGFMTASAAVAAGYTLATGPVRADVITTDTKGLDAGDAKVKVADGEMPAYFARPAGASNPPVILVAMEIFGLHEYIKDVTRRLAKLGAFAVAPDYYFRKGVDLTKITDIQQLLPLVNAKPDAELLSDLDSTVAWAKSQGGDTSPSSASSASAAAAARYGNMPRIQSELKAGVAFYGPPVDPPNPLWPKSPTQLAPDMKAPVLGLYGEADTGIPVATRRGAEAGAGCQQEDRRVQDLSGRTSRLPCRLPHELSQGGRRGRLEPDAGLVQEVPRVELRRRLHNEREAHAQSPVAPRGDAAGWRDRPAKVLAVAERSATPCPGRHALGCRLLREHSGKRGADDTDDDGELRDCEWCRHGQVRCCMFVFVSN